MKYINISDLVARDWRFLEALDTKRSLEWAFCYGRPANWLERKIRRPAVGRYRACLSAVSMARKAPNGVLVSHLPAVSLVTAALARWRGVKKPHVAFAFNYTDLPTGRRLDMSRRYFSDIAEFVVFSRYEIALYSDLFGLPKERFHFLHWTMEPPRYDPDHTLPFDTPYLCSIGGEGRDYRVLAEAMRQLPDLKMAVVARPASIAGIDFPSNMRVFTNLPSTETWAIARGSIGMALPLKSGHTPNGHVTLVGAQLLGIPLIITRSAGVTDYVDDTTATLVEAGSVTEMRQALEDLQARPDCAEERAARAREIATVRSDPTVWLRYFEDLDHRLSKGRK